MGTSLEEDNNNNKRAKKKDWKSILTNDIIPTLANLRQNRVSATLRKMFYNLVVKLAIGNTTSDYKTLSDVTKDARMNGIIPIDCFVDRIRQTFDVNEYKDDSEFEELDDYIEWGINYLRDAPDDYVKSLPKWYKQKYYVEHWIEKAALYSSFEAYLGDNRQVRITLNRGYDGLGDMVKNVRRLRKIAKEESEKEICLYYSGDLDPSGDDMDRDLIGRIESVSAKLNVDEFLNTEFVMQTRKESKIKK